MSLCLLEIPGRKAPSRAVALLVQDRACAWVSLGLGKERAQGGAGVGDLSHEMTECRKEAREGLIHEHHLSAYCVPLTAWALGTRPGIWRIRLCRCRTRSEPEPESNTCNAKLQF